MLTFPEKGEKPIFWSRVAKNSFSQLHQKIEVLGHKLLLKSNINVAIANILLGQKYLSDLQKPRYGFLAKISQSFLT